jgi:hypothetical protein
VHYFWSGNTPLQQNTISDVSNTEQAFNRVAPPTPNITSYTIFDMKLIESMTTTDEMSAALPTPAEVAAYKSQGSMRRALDIQQWSQDWIERLGATGDEANAIELLCAIAVYDGSDNPHHRHVAAQWLVDGQRQVKALFSWIQGQNTGHEPLFLRTFEKYF